jgi:hypothetical protein
LVSSQLLLPCPFLTLITRGKFEWNGDWSDKSALWNQHPQIKFEMGFSNSGCCYAMLAISLLPPRPLSLPLCWLLSSVPDKHDDGIFYMSWNDFVKYFNSVDVCYTQKDLSYLQLNIYESFNVFGPFIGCLIGESLFLSLVLTSLPGCFKYWVCCFGFYYLWCLKPIQNPKKVTPH